MTSPLTSLRAACLLLFTGTSLLSGLPLAAETTARPGRLDARVTSATYQPGQVYTVYTDLRTVTLVELAAGERIQAIAIGDLDSFKIDRLEGQNRFIIKPTISGVSTNVTVETTGRIYFLNVIATSRHRPMYAVRFALPAERASGATAVTGSHAPAPLLPPLRYRILKKPAMPAFTPVAIGDDGQRTVFRLPTDAPIPVIYRADAEGRETAVNASVKGTTITVGGRAGRWVLRLGDDFVCIEGRQR